MSSRLALHNQRIVGCRLCDRLVRYQEKVSQIKRAAYKNQTYWGRPVPGFGRCDARIMIVGLAPGAHGANRTGRIFTGDASGDFLFAALHRAGLASQPQSINRDDGMKLNDCYITSAVRCAPPHNRPTDHECTTCRRYLVEDIRLLSKCRVYLCLGRIAYDAIQAALRVRLGRFSHGAQFQHQDRTILCSYHVSRRNTQTGLLTTEMFDRILVCAKRLANLDESPCFSPNNEPLILPIALQKRPPSDKIRTGPDDR